MDPFPTYNSVVNIFESVKVICYSSILNIKLFIKADLGYTLFIKTICDENNESKSIVTDVLRVSWNCKHWNKKSLRTQVAIF